MAIIRKGEPALVKGYGEANVEHHVPVTADTIFQSGSVGKQFTAAAIMTLVDEGKLSLDDSLTKFWPEAPAWWHAVTIRHLLTHTSGIGNFEPFVGIDYRKDYTDDEFAKLALALKPEFHRQPLELRRPRLCAARLHHWQGDRTALRRTAAQHVSCPPLGMKTATSSARPTSSPIAPQATNWPVEC